MQNLVDNRLYDNFTLQKPGRAFCAKNSGTLSVNNFQSIFSIYRDEKVGKLLFLACSIALLGISCDREDMLDETFTEGISGTVEIRDNGYAYRNNRYRRYPAHEPTGSTKELFPPRAMVKNRMVPIAITSP